MIRRRCGLLHFLPAMGALLLSGCAAGPGPASFPPVPDRLDGFTAEYRIDWKSAGPRKARLALAYRPPERLRLEILGPLGSSRAVLVTAPGGGILLDPPRREFRRYADARDAIKALTGIALEPDLLAALLLGDPARAPRMECRADGSGTAPGKICRGPGGEPTLRIGSDGGVWEIRRQGADPLRIEMVFGRGHAEGPPRRILLREGRAGIWGDLRLREIRFLPPAEGLFSLQPPGPFREARGELPAPVHW